MDIVHYLRLLLQHDGTDLYFSANATPFARTGEGMQALSETRLEPGQIGELAYSVMNDAQVREFEATMECNLAISINGIGRFRVNIFRQRGGVAMVVRHIRGDIPGIQDLQLPALLKELIMESSGLVLVVGTAGAGISTTLASMLDYRNATSEGHILTIEDPVEYLHKNKRSIVNQREIGLDSLSYESAMRNALRESPDVIMLGELRDADFVRGALAYAERGCLCVSSLHATDVCHAIERLQSFFPVDAHARLHTDLALNLRGVVAQRQVRAVTGGTVPAIESLVPDQETGMLIKNGELGRLREAMLAGEEEGIISLDQALGALFNDGRISRNEALANANDPTSLTQLLND